MLKCSEAKFVDFMFDVSLHEKIDWSKVKMQALTRGKLLQEDPRYYLKKGVLQKLRAYLSFEDRSCPEARKMSISFNYKDWAYINAATNRQA